MRGSTHKAAARLAALTIAPALLLALPACSGPQDKQDPNPVDTAQQNLQGKGEGEGSGVDPDAWNCAGNLVPPTGWKQETAFVDLSTPNPVQAAVDQARGRLVQRLCGSGSNCDALAARADAWKQGRDSKQACAMVVIKKKELEAWRRAATSAKGLDDALVAAATELIGVDGKKRKVAIGKIVDGGVPGGERAEWLAARMNRAITLVGARVASVPKDWNGQGVPPGVHVVLNARTFERTEGQKDIVEVNWVAKVKSGRTTALRSARAVTFPVDAAPSMNSAVTLFPPNDPGLTVHVESGHPSGGLCIGERTQVFLTADEDLHVRVFDLYGEDGALLLFPNPDRPDGRINKGETIKLGGDAGFEAVPVPGSEVERFLVLGAKKKAGLGPFAGSSGYCRVRPDVAKRLHDGQGFPKTARASSDGFRLIEGPSCSSSISDAKRKKMAEQLDAIPACK